MDDNESIIYDDMSWQLQPNTSIKGQLLSFIGSSKSNSLVKVLRAWELDFCSLFQAVRIRGYVFMVHLEKVQGNRSSLRVLTFESANEFSWLLNVNPKPCSSCISQSVEFVCLALSEIVRPCRHLSVHTESDEEAKNSTTSSRGWMKKAAFVVTLGLGVVGFMAMPKARRFCQGLDLGTFQS